MPELNKQSTGCNVIALGRHSPLVRGGAHALTERLLGRFKKGSQPNIGIGSPEKEKLAKKMQEACDGMVIELYRLRCCQREHQK
jgi:hypothetical protein